MRNANMRKPPANTTRLPQRLPLGTHYVIEGQRRKDGGTRIVSRKVILPNGEHFDVTAPGAKLASSVRRKPASRRRRGG